MIKSINYWAMLSFFAIQMLPLQKAHAEDVTTRLCNLSSIAAAYGMASRIRGIPEQEAVTKWVDNLRENGAPSHEIGLMILFLRGAYKTKIQPPDKFKSDQFIECIEISMKR